MLTCLRPLWILNLKQWKHLSLITAWFNIICMFFLKPQWSSCFCQQEAGAKVPLQGSTCVCYYTFHSESGTVYHCLFNQRMQIMTLCLHFRSMNNLNQCIAVSTAAMRKAISLHCRLVLVSLYSPFPSTVSATFSLSLNSPQHEIFPPQPFVVLQLSWKRSCVSISGLHSHVHRALATHVRAHINEKYTIHQ